MSEAYQLLLMGGVIFFIVRCIQMDTWQGLPALEELVGEVLAAVILSIMFMMVIHVWPIIILIKLSKPRD